MIRRSFSLALIPLAAVAFAVPAGASRIKDIVDVEGYATRADADAARERGKRVLTHFYEWWSREDRNIEAIEKGFSSQAGNQTVTGRFDRIERTAEGLHVIDFKTYAPRSQEAVDSDLQLSLYALAVTGVYNEPCTQLTLLFLREDGVVEQSTTRTEAQLQKAQERIAKNGEQIEQGDYPPLPEPTKCSRCPYRNVCPAAAA